MNNLSLIKDIMTTQVVTVKPNDIYKKVYHIFKENNFHHIPVVDDDNKVVGIISKNDFFQLCESQTFFTKEYEQGRNLRYFESLLVEDVMIKQVATLKPKQTLLFAAGIFKENLFHALPIVNDKDQLVGVLTTFDLLNYAYSVPVM